MSSLKVTLGILAAGLMLSGCMQGTTYEATNTTNFKPRDKELLAKVSYVKTPVAGGLPPRHRRLSPQGSARLDRGRFRQPLPLPGAGERQGDPLRHHRRRGSHGVVRHRQGRQQDRVAALASDAGRNFPPRRAEIRGARTGQSDGLARALSLLGRQGHAVPDSRHQPAGIYRRVDLVGLHPHDQRGRHRSLRPRRSWHGRGGAGAEARRLAVQFADGAAGRRQRSMQ